MRQDLYSALALDQGGGRQRQGKNLRSTSSALLVPMPSGGMSFSVGCPGFQNFQREGSGKETWVKSQSHLSCYKGSVRLRILLASQWFLNAQQSEKSQC